MPTGRFAPSPTGSLHVGNLRTGLVAWLAARVDGSRFELRYEDLDAGAIRPEYYQRQADDLLAIGLDWDGQPRRQSDRLDHYREALDQLVADDAVYSCYCSRREIREAAQAPNAPSANYYRGHRYPGTCRDLTAAQRAEKARQRPPAIRLRADGEVRHIDDHIMGPADFELDDFVVQRNDGVPAYHLVVVVDDADQGIEMVVRADDLLESAARQMVLHERLDLPVPQYAHVPLVLGSDGDRLAKRHGAVGLDDRRAIGQSPTQVVGFLANSLGLATESAAEAGLWPADLIEGFSFDRLPRTPLTLPADWLAIAADRPTVQDSSSSDTV